MSVGHQINGTARRSGSRSNFSETSSHSDQKHQSGFVSPKELDESAGDYDDHPHDARVWLLSFGDLATRSDGSKTEVSRRFRIDETSYHDEPSHSMLPLLGQWLDIWFERSLSDSSTKGHVVWLLHYIADYVDLKHIDLDPDEVCTLCRKLLYVCSQARHQIHLESCIAVFLAITRNHLFPRKCLTEVLGTLSAARVILEKPLVLLPECVQKLASGELADDTIAALYAQMLAIRQTDSKQQYSHVIAQGLTPARGAIRLLSALLDTIELDAKHAVKLERLLQVAKQTAETGIMRLSTDILHMLYHLLRSARSEELIARRTLMADLLDVFENCKQSTIIPDQADTSSRAAARASREDEAEREARYKTDHERATAACLGAIAAVLPKMDLQSASRAWQQVKAGTYLRAEARAGAIQYIRDRQICIPGKNQSWYEELQLLITRVVVGKTPVTDMDMEKDLYAGEEISQAFLEQQVDQRINQRIAVLHLCVEAIRICAYEPDAASQGLPKRLTSSEAGTQSLQRLLSIVHFERSKSVMRALLKDLVGLCAINVPQQEQPYASIIISTLLESILQRAPADQEADGNYRASAKALRAIFLQSLTTSAVVAYQTYQALLEIADCTKCKSARSRLVAMSVLFRIRCNTGGCIYIDNASDSDYIAGALCKTAESLEAMFSDAGASTEDIDAKLDKVSRKQLWMYPQEADAVKKWSIPSTSIVAKKSPSATENAIDIADWIYLINTNLINDKEWETYSYTIVHFGSQLKNTWLFEHSQDYLATLRGFLSGRIREPANMFEPPKDIGMDKADVALCVYHILERLIPYAKMQPPSPHLDTSRRGVDLVRAFRAGVGENLYEGTARSCIHALSVCCFELPEAIATEYPGIIVAMMQMISQSHLLVHVLEFLAQVARLPHLHRYFADEEIRQIFGICISALNKLRSEDHTGTESKPDSKRISAHTRSKGGLLTPYRAAMLKEKGLTQYSCALAYHTMIFWFLSIPISKRHERIKDIIPRLIRTDADGNGNIDQQTIVLIDMMQRTAFSDLGETARDDSFSSKDFETSSFIDGNSVITIETHRTTGRSQITKRQASGTTHAVYTPLLQELTSHHDRAFRDLPDRARPSHTFLNMVGTAIPIEPSEQPLKLNSNEPYVGRALSMLDRLPTVDSHAIGVTLLREGQQKESDYLANIKSTPDFDDFLNVIGTKVSLHPPLRYTPFGLLPRDDEGQNDGDDTYAWRDRINEIVFQVSTLMPNTEDTQQTRKKSHLGNCKVLIVFNQSNQPWKWEYFQSQATLVTIVITPANRVSNAESSDDFEHDFYMVNVLTKEEYQNISAAAETKVVSRATLPHLVRLLALNANIFSGCAMNESTGDTEFPSSWRSRLQQIVQLRERTQQRVHDSEDTLAKRYDFNRWT